MPEFTPLFLPVPFLGSDATAESTPAHHSAEAPEMSLPEAIQWVLQTGYNTLQYAWPESAAAALIELTLAGRIGSVPSRWIFSSPVGRRIIVLDATPTGHPELDVVLAYLARRRTPKKVGSDFWTIGDLASSAVQKRLVSAGSVQKFGEFRINRSYLVVKDAARHQLALDWLQRVRADPSTVTDPRAGASHDLLQASYRRFTHEVGTLDLESEWYPSDMFATIQGIVHVEQAATASVFITS